MGLVGDTKPSMLIGSSGDEPENELEYSQTSRKRPLKRRRFSGRLRKVVVYKDQTKDVFFEEVSTHYSLPENLLLAICKFRIRVVPCCH